MKKQRKRRASPENSEVAVTGVPQLYAKSFSSRFGEEKSFAAEMALYGALRDQVPILDGALSKIVRLTGGFHAECPDKRNETLLTDFLKTVRVGGNAVGIDAFLDSFLNQLLTYGTAVGEMVMDRSLRSFSLWNASLKGLTVSRNPDDPMQTLISSGPDGKTVPLDRNGTILFAALNPDAEKPYGNSLLKGLPFVSAVLMQIFESIGANWERMGNLRYAVTYRPQNDALDKAYAKERAMQIAKGWSDAMKTGGEIKDFIAVGDVDIKVIGADNQVLDSEVPVRQLLEQILAKTGLPPFMLGLNWSTTERMAQQQADLFTSELYHYRRILTPVVLQICRMVLRMNGLPETCEIIWDDVTLLDETEEAKARYYHAQADKYEAEAKALAKGE